MGESLDAYGRCAFCRQDSGGIHEPGCPYSAPVPMAVGRITLPIDYDTGYSIGFRDGLKKAASMCGLCIVRDDILAERIVNDCQHHSQGQYCSSCAARKDAIEKYRASILEGKEGINPPTPFTNRDSDSENHQVIKS